MDNEHASPLMLEVPLGNRSETDLMAALEYVITSLCPPLVDAPPQQTPPGIERAVDWLHAKYGTKRVALLRLPAGEGE